jgi:uncharacterized protein (DUF433 family)
MAFLRASGRCRTLTSTEQGADGDQADSVHHLVGVSQVKEEALLGGPRALDEPPEAHPPTNQTNETNETVLFLTPHALLVPLAPCVFVLKPGRNWGTPKTPQELRVLFSACFIVLFCAILIKVFVARIYFAFPLSCACEMMMEELLKRITFDQNILRGKPLIRGLRISVEMLLELLAKGSTEQEILEDYPELEPDDIRAALIYAHSMVATEEVFDRVKAS